MCQESQCNCDQALALIAENKRLKHLLEACIQNIQNNRKILEEVIPTLEQLSSGLPQTTGVTNESENQR